MEEERIIEDAEAVVDDALVGLSVSDSEEGADEVVRPDAHHSHHGHHSSHHGHHSSHHGHHSHHSHHSHHRSHSHSSHHGHGSRRKSSKKKDNKFVSFFKRNRSAIVILCLCFLVAFLLVMLAIDHDKLKKASGVKNSEDTGSFVSSSSSVKIDVTYFSEDVSLVSAPVEQYFSGETTKSAHDLWRDNKGNLQRLDVGLPVRISYNVSGLPSGITVTKSVLEISEAPSFESAHSFTNEGKSNVVDVYHLKVGTHYYYRVTAETSAGKSVNAGGDFETVAAPRMMKIDGAVNVRDIGGWETVDGKVIKQGLLYRGSEIDGAVETEYCITEKGRNEMLSVLGIRSEMDLRAKDQTPEGKDALGDNVEHIYYGIPMYSDLLADNAAGKVREIFSYLADEAHYPVYLHCTYGRDRTGTVCYLLEALLGLSDGDLKKEYELSGFYNGFTDVEGYATMANEVKHLDGATTKEKVENYLLSIGVTAEEIESIRNIFIEDKN